MKRNYRQGFTLMELLIVMAILVALFALLLPSIFNRQKQSYISQAQIKINSLEGNLELYSNQNRGYPTTEQGLNALIYIPDNVGQAVQQPLTGGMNPGQPADLMNPQGQGDAMAGNAASIGPEAFNNAVPGQNPMQNLPGNTGAIPNDPMGGQANAMNPMGGGMGAGGMNASTWNQPTFNPQLYTQQRKRPAPYAEPGELIDPWGMPYRYENNLAFSGLNRTGTAKPAIWSAGPDKIDYTDDDIRNWDPVEAQQQITVHQQRMQGGGMGIDPMGNNSMMMGNQPMGGQLPAGQGMPMGQLPAGQGMPMGQPGGGIPTAPPAEQGMPTAPPMPTQPGI